MMNEQIIERLKKKDETALKEVMTMYKNQVFNYLALMLGNRHKAEELTQDTFVTLYFKAGSIRTGNLKAWIYKVAINHARNELRKKRIKDIFSISQIDESDLRIEPSQEGKLRLDQMLALIPVKYRGVVVMKQVEDFSFEEISEILEKPIGTVKSLVHRGLKHLRLNLENQQSPDFEVQEGGING